MAGLDPLDLTTRQEKIISVSIALGSILVHILLLFFNYKDFWPKQEQERKLMVIRPLFMEPGLAPPEEGGGPTAKQVFGRKEVVVESARKAEQKDAKKQDERRSKDDLMPPPPKPPEKGEDEKIPPPEKKPNTVTIYTDLGQAFFRLEGPVTYKGAGTFWEKKDLPLGDYRAVFGTVEGFQTPEPQSGTLVEGGSLVFTGRYTKMTHVSVNVKPPPESPRFKIIRPDGQYLDLKGSKEGMFDNLPEGTYTIIFEDEPGFATPGPQSQNLAAGGSLSFSGKYSQLGAGTGSGRGAGGGSGTGAGWGSGMGGGGQGWGAGGQGARGTKVASKTVQKGPATLDRRIKMVVKSYPETGIEQNYGFVTYPERAIKKADFQEGWCQVYVVVRVNGSGEIVELYLERPKPEDKEKFAPLIDVVETSVRKWDFDRQEAEIHVDVRFYVERR